MLPFMFFLLNNNMQLKFLKESEKCVLRTVCFVFKSSLCDRKVLHDVKKRHISNISRTLVDNKIVDHSDIVGASPQSALHRLHLHSRLINWRRWIGQRQGLGLGLQGLYSTINCAGNILGRFTILLQNQIARVDSFTNLTKRWVFVFRLSASISSNNLISFGKQFHARGPYTANARWQLTGRDEKY